MDAQSITIDALLKTGSIAAIVGKRITPALQPQSNSYPYITLQTISDGREYSHDGYSGIKKVRLQLSVYAEDDGISTGYAIARNLLDLITTAMEGINNSHIQAVFKNTEAEGVDPATRINWGRADFILEYRE